MNIKLNPGRAGNRKGQAISNDLIISVVIFLLALAIVLEMWGDAVSNIYESEELSDLERYSVEVSERLVRTPGIPGDWEINNVALIGLANEEPRLLNSTKILKLVDLLDNHYDNRSILGAKEYEIYFNMTYINDTDMSENQLSINNGTQDITCAAGILPAKDAQVLTTMRTSILNDTIVRIYFTVWTPYYD